MSEKNISEKPVEMNELAGEGFWKRLPSCVTDVPPYIKASYSEVRLAMHWTSLAFQKSLPESVAWIVWTVHWH